MVPLLGISMKQSLKKDPGLCMGQWWFWCHMLDDVEASKSPGYHMQGNIAASRALDVCCGIRYGPVRVLCPQLLFGMIQEPLSVLNSIVWDVVKVSQGPRCPGTDDARASQGGGCPVRHEVGWASEVQEPVPTMSIVFWYILMRTQSRKANSSLCFSNKLRQTLE